MNNQSKKRIAIQGGSGSFHEISAIFHFGLENITTVPFETFSELVDSVENNDVDYGLMAIENTVAGSIMPNYALLKGRNIGIKGEILLRIEQNLLALDGQSIEDIKEVHSHPMALMQCHEFFKKYPHIKLMESDDTANSARRIQEQKLMGIGAIASQRAAGLFNLSVIKPGIETNKRNFTRFLILKPISETNLNGSNGVKTNKASISFSLKHKTGSLSNVLSIFSFYNINLSKIQSIPIIGREWEYHFLVDFVYDDYKVYQQSLVAIKPLTAELQVMGEYVKADRYHHSNEVVSDAIVEDVSV
jgi:prephenate dehydratase